MAGDVQIEDREVLTEVVEVIVCRWCSASDQIEVVLRPDLGGPSRESAGDGGP